MTVRSISRQGIVCYFFLPGRANFRFHGTFQIFRPRKDPQEMDDLAAKALVSHRSDLWLAHRQITEHSSSRWLSSPATKPDQVSRVQRYSMSPFPRPILPSATQPGGWFRAALHSSVASGSVSADMFLPPQYEWQLCFCSIFLRGHRFLCSLPSTPKSDGVERSSLKTDLLCSSGIDNIL